MPDTDPSVSAPSPLVQSLSSALLCCCSPMIAAVRTLERSHRFKLRLEVAGRTDPGYRTFVHISRQLDVEIEECELSGLSKERPYDWAFDHGAKNQRAWVPDARDRVGDYHVWLPFCSEHHQRRLTKHDPDFTAPKVDSLYLLLLWSECFGPLKTPISARVLKDLLAWDQVSTISAVRYQGTSRDNIRKASRQATALTKQAQMYLGFFGGSQGAEMCRWAGLESHPFNSFARQVRSVAQPGSADVRSFPPWLVSSQTWQATMTGVLIENAWALDAQIDTLVDSKSKPDLLTICLHMRLEGLTEDEIATRLEFESRAQYDRWMEEHCLDTDPTRLEGEYDRWFRACEEFGLEPNDSLVDELTSGTPATEMDRDATGSLPQAMQAKDGPVEQEPAPPFKHSPDHRSLSLPGGHRIVLTEKQAHVIAILHENWLNGTPELSQSFVIGEVYPKNQTGQLRKLFGDKEAYDLLVERGSRRGLVRLKAGRKRRTEPE